MFDFIFAAPSDEPADSALITAVSSAANVYFGLAFDLAREPSAGHQDTVAESTVRYLENTKWQVTGSGPPSDFFIGENPLITFPALASAAKGLGFLSVKSDPDGVFRRIPLLVRYNDAYYPSFAFRTICDYLGVPPEKVIVQPGKSITLKDAKRPEAAAGHDIVVPTDRYGNLRINFIGPWDRMTHYHFSDVLRAADDRDELELWAEELAGKIVIISEVTTGSSDIGPVPTDARFPLSGLHANVMHAILTGSFLRELTAPQMLCIELLLALFIWILSARFSSIPFSIGAVAIGAGYLGAVAICFLYFQIIFHIVRPLLMTTLAMTAILIYRYINEEKAKEVLRKSFEAYFPPAIVQKLMANPRSIAERGVKKELTILFSDIKNFTGHSSTLTPEHVQRLLNEYFEAMTEIVFKHGGTIDKFIGDGLMVFFGDPEPQPDHAVRCVQAAMEMQHKVAALRQSWEKRGDFPIRIRIGINTGQVSVGNMGSARRLSYTVLGADVNLAQRLESNAPVDGIMISQRTHALVKDHVETRSLDKIRAKGFDEPISFMRFW